MRSLVPHPDSRPGAVRTVGALARRTDEGRLALTYAIEGDLAALRIAAPRPARIGYKLWRHTCCEAFIAAPGAAGYREFNFSPSGEWTAYAFTAYREGGVLEDPGSSPQVATQVSDRRLELSARVDAPLPGRLLLGLAVIIEQMDGGFSYWALRHPPGRPDFHHRDGFALELA